jgi:hypothetical protein
VTLRSHEPSPTDLQNKTWMCLPIIIIVYFEGWLQKRHFVSPFSDAHLVFKSTSQFRSRKRLSFTIASPAWDFVRCLLPNPLRTARCCLSWSCWPPLLQSLPMPSIQMPFPTTSPFFSDSARLITPTYQSAFLKQSGSTVEFTVGNTWTTDAGDSVDQIFTAYPGDALGTKACHLSENVSTMHSIDSKLQAYCTPTGVAIIRMYVRDANFDPVKDTATIPECCVDPNNNPSSPPALEYIAILNCNPTCAAVKFVSAMRLTIHSSSCIPQHHQLEVQLRLLLFCPQTRLRFRPQEVQRQGHR